jgi:hypothetical protein
MAAAISAAPADAVERELAALTAVAPPR